MRKALVFSLILHLAVVVVAYFGVPMAQKELVAGSEAVAIDVVAVAETTNLPPPRPATQPAPPTPAARVDAKPQLNLKPQVPAKPQPPAPSKPETAKVEPPPKADPPVQAKAPAPEAQPQQAAKAKPQQAAEAQPPKPAPPAPVPERQAATAETQPPKPAPPPKPAQPEKPAADQPAPAAVAQPAPDSAAGEAKPAAATDFQSVLKTVDSLARNEPRKPGTEAAANKARPEVEPPRADARETGAASPQPGFDSLIERALDSSAASASASGGTYNPTQPMSVSEIDEVRRQIERCWNIPAGARDAGNHVVTIRVEMSPDATPRSAVVLNEAGTRGNAFHRAAAESALRAVLNPRCHPFRLPIEKYERWKTMTLVFNPKDMLGT
jgi:TolA protein